MPCHSKHGNQQGYVREDADLLAYEADEPCQLCLALGRTEAAPGHTLARCFTNPKSDHIEPRVCRVRMAQLRALKAQGV